MNEAKAARGAWIDDLAIAAAPTLRDRWWLTRLGVLAALVVCVVGPRATAPLVAVGWVAAALGHRRFVATRWSGHRGALVASAVALLSAAVGAFVWLADPGAFERTELRIPAVCAAVVGVLLVAAASRVATAVGGGAPTRLIALAVFVPGLLLTVGLGSDRLLGREAIVAGSAAEFVLYVGLALCAARGRWIAAVLAATTVLTVYRQAPANGGSLYLPHLAGPLSVVFGARLAAALRCHSDGHGTGQDAADAAIARLARRIVWHPWRTSLVLLPIAALASFDFYLTSFAAAGVGMPGSPALAVGFLATPGPLALCACVLFHGLLRGRSPFDLAAPLTVPMLAVGGVWILVQLPRAGGGPDTLQLLAIVLGLGPLLPVLSGAAFGRGASRTGAIRSGGGRAALVLSVVVCALVVLPVAAHDAIEKALRAGSPDETSAWQLMGLAAIPWAIAFHLFVVAPIDTTALLRRGLVAAALTACALAALPGDIDMRGGDIDGIPAAILGTCLFSVIAVYTVGALALARRLRDLTVLWPDHAVVLWADAVRDD